MTVSQEEMVNKVRSTHGLIGHNAALADSCLYEAFHHFAGCKREFSRAIYFTLDSVVGRISLVKRVAEVAKADEATLELLDTLGKAIKASITHRNGFAHSFLLLYQDTFGFDDYIKVVNPKRANAGGERVTEESLAAAAKASREHLRKVGEAFEALCLKLGIEPQVSI